MALDQVCRDGRKQENGWDFTSNRQAAPPVHAAGRAPAHTTQQVVEVPPGYLLVRDDCEPPPLKAMFDRRTEKFLNQVWIYL